MTETGNLGELLERHPARRTLLEHPLFAYLAAGSLTEPEDAELIAGQWWHPLHGFPTFLGRCVAQLPGMEAKSAVARILAQETGGGSPERAHEAIYLESLRQAGLDWEEVRDSEPNIATRSLMMAYDQLPATPEGALGALYATETADLAMVTAIGHAIRSSTGQQEIPWVDIHVREEPGHVKDAFASLMDEQATKAPSAVIAAASVMWAQWAGFFNELAAELGVPEVRAKAA